MIVAGFGFRQGADAASFADALAQANHQARPQKTTSLAPEIFATLARKAPDMEDFARACGTPLVLVTYEEARVQKTPTQSLASQAETGLGSVAEACALAAAGPGANLLGPRAVSSDRMATCALARSAA